MKGFFGDDGPTSSYGIEVYWRLTVARRCAIVILSWLSEARPFLPKVLIETLRFPFGLKGTATLFVARKRLFPAVICAILLVATGSSRCPFVIEACILRSSPFSHVLCVLWNARHERGYFVLWIDLSAKLWDSVNGFTGAGMHVVAGLLPVLKTWIP